MNQFLLHAAHLPDHAMLKALRFSLVLSMAMEIGCSQKAKRVSLPSVNASKAGVEAVAVYDTDQDGKISGSELDKCMAIRSSLGLIDKDGDKAITADEIAGRIRAWQESKIGRLSVKCIVSRNGRPLTEADVRFVPEKFLGDEFKSARGKTDRRGVAIIGTEVTDGSRSRGVSPGLYRVEVTKSGENIPAIYNTETTLGQEIAADASGIREGFKFNLTQ